jgi:hypothetical protein
MLFICVSLPMQGGKQTYNRVKEEIMQVSNADSPSCSNSVTSQNQVAADSPISVQMSEYEDAESGMLFVHLCSASSTPSIDLLMHIQLCTFFQCI